MLSHAKVRLYVRTSFSDSMSHTEGFDDVSVPPTLLESTHVLLLCLYQAFALLQYDKALVLFLASGTAFSISRPHIKLRSCSRDVLRHYILIRYAWTPNLLAPTGNHSF